MARPHLAIVGGMGTGKTTVGRLVGDLNHWPFLDLDEELARREGRSVAHQFRDDGEPAFRQREHDLLSETMARETRHVVATGGGVVLRSDNRELLARRAWVVWLRADAARAARRATGDATVGRPLLDGADDPAARLRSLGEERASWYAAVADLVVDTDDLTPHEVADRLIAHLPASEGSVT